MPTRSWRRFVASSCRARSRWRWAGSGAGSWRRRHAAARRRRPLTRRAASGRRGAGPWCCAVLPIAALGLAHVEPRAAQHQLAGDGNDGGGGLDKAALDFQLVQRHVPVAGDDAAAVVASSTVPVRVRRVRAPPDRRCGTAARGRACREFSRREHARRAGRPRACRRATGGSTPAANGIAPPRAGSVASSRRRGPVQNAASPLAGLCSAIRRRRAGGRGCRSGLQVLPVLAGHRDLCFHRRGARPRTRSLSSTSHAHRVCPA